MSKSKAEQYYEDELGKLLLHSIHAHNGKLEEEIYRILNEGEVLSDPCGIEAAEHQAYEGQMKPREWQYGGIGSEDYRIHQADLLYQDLCRSFNQNFKEYVFTDREHGISIRINFQKEKK